MVRLTVTFLIFFVSGLSFGQDSTVTEKCDYRTGEFYVLSGSDTCRISRNEERQTEKCGNSETAYELIVIWLKDDKYLLRDIHYNPSTKPVVMRKDVVMTVMEVGADYHVVNVKIKGERNRLMTVYCNEDKE